MKITIICAAALTLGGCAAVTDTAENRVGVADLRSSTGQSVGTAVLNRTGNSLTLQVDVNGLPPGPHGFHLHTTGRCDAPDFTSAGGHLNPDNNDHGPFQASGGHLGDLLNLDVGPDGQATYTYQVAGSADQRLPQIFDADGTAVLVHRDADDYQTDLAGDAGPRIACGVLERN